MTTNNLENMKIESEPQCPPEKSGKKVPPRRKKGRNKAPVSWGDFSINEKYIEADRPYSQNEIHDIRNRFLASLAIDNVVYACHNKCGHTYYVKKFGRKRKEILDSNNHDTGNCSVCWKLRNTPADIRPQVIDLIDYYMSIIPKLSNHMLHNDLHVEKI